MPFRDSEGRRIDGAFALRGAAGVLLTVVTMVVPIIMVVIPRDGHVITWP